jgi:hypothetical protein
MVKLPDVSKMIGIDWLGVAPQMGEMYPQKLLLRYPTLPCLTLLYLFLASLCRLDGQTDLHAQWLKQRGLLQGGALWRRVCTK